MNPVQASAHKHHPRGDEMNVVMEFNIDGTKIMICSDSILQDDHQLKKADEHLEETLWNILTGE